MNNLNRTVCLVEYDPNLRRALERILTARDFSPIGFDSAAAFLASEECHDAACLVIDMDLPVTSGLELCARLGAMSERVPVIFTTEYPAQHTSARARALGAIAVLAKPFGATALLMALERALLVPRQRSGAAH